jgi:hypothetical protein
MISSSGCPSGAAVFVIISISSSMTSLSSDGPPATAEPLRIPAIAAVAIEIFRSFLKSIPPDIRIGPPFGRPVTMPS